MRRAAATAATAAAAAAAAATAAEIKNVKKNFFIFSGLSIEAGDNLWTSASLSIESIYHLTGTEHKSHVRHCLGTDSGSVT